MKTNEKLREDVAKAIFDKFVQGDSYGWGNWMDFLEEADAAINIVFKSMYETD